MNAVPLEHLGASLARLGPRMAGAGQPWLVQQRREAVASLQRLGFPQRRDEAWRYTSVEPLLRHDFVPAIAGTGAAVSAEAFQLPHLEAHLAVFVNGRFDAGLSALEDLPEGITIGSLGQAIERSPDVPARWLGRVAGVPAHAFSALNTAAIDDGLLLHVAAGQRLERPLLVLHLTTAPTEAVVAQSRNLLVLEPGAQATLIEHYASPFDTLYFNNSLTEIVLQDGAGLEHYRLQRESTAASHLHSLFVDQHESSRYRNTGFALGGAWSRTELNINFLGAYAAADLDGLYVSGDRQLSDVHVDIRHAVPGCESRTNYRGLLHGRGRAVFDGRIEVSRDAQKTDAHLHNDNLLLSRSAEVDAKPQLEIHADDVSCSHGTTVGQLDPAQLFYLRSRGIGAGEAQRLLCLGFAAEVLQRCHIAPLRDCVEAAVAERLAMTPDNGDR